MSNCSRTISTHRTGPGKTKMYGRKESLCKRGLDHGSFLRSMQPMKRWGSGGGLQGRRGLQK